MPGITSPRPCLAHSLATIDAPKPLPHPADDHPERILSEAKRGGAEVAEEDAEGVDWVGIFGILSFSALLSATSAPPRFDQPLSLAREGRSLPHDRQHAGDFRPVVVMRAGAVGNLIVGNADDLEVAAHVIGLAQSFVAQFVPGEGLGGNSLSFVCHLVMSRKG